MVPCLECENNEVGMKRDWRLGWVVRERFSMESGVPPWMGEECGGGGVGLGVGVGGGRGSRW